VSLIYALFMADIIELVLPEKSTPANIYSVDIVQYPDNLAFTVKDITVNPAALLKIAEDLEKVVQIIRNDVVTGVV